MENWQGTKMTSKRMTKEQWAALLRPVCERLEAEGYINRNARMTMGDKWRFGTNGSLAVDVEKGTWFSHEASKGGGTLLFVQWVLETDKDGAMKWLKNEDFIETDFGRFKRRSGRGPPNPSKYRAKADRARTTAKQKPGRAISHQEIAKNTLDDWARQLWRESEPIGAASNHPFRQWAAARSLLHPFCVVPDCIRYHAGKGFILAALYPIGHKGEVPDCVHKIEIDQRGNQKGGKGNKKTPGDLAKSVFRLGYGKTGRVYVCEGLADALALYSRFSGVVLSPMGAVSNIANRPGLLEYLRDREVVICCDLDIKPDGSTPGQDAGEILKDVLLSRCTKRVKLVTKYDSGKDPADEARARGFPQIDQYDFDEVAGKLLELYDMSEADRRAILTLSTERLQ